MVVIEGPRGVFARLLNVFLGLRWAELVLLSLSRASGFRLSPLR